MSAASDCKQESKVQNWLNSIPESGDGVTLGDVDLNLDAADASKSVKFGCKCNPVKIDETKSLYLQEDNICVHEKHGNKGTKMYLQGWSCNINPGRSKTDLCASKKEVKATRRVTFKFSEDFIDVSDLDEVKTTQPQANTTKSMDNDRNALHRGMREYLQEIARKRREKLGKRGYSYITDDMPHTWGETDAVIDEAYDMDNDLDRQRVADDIAEETGRAAGTFDDIVCVGRNDRCSTKSVELKKPVPYTTSDSHPGPNHRVRLPPWGAKSATHLPRRVQANRRVLEKPTIKGLVVDSATNQQPSIVRASKNANIREEFALKTRIDGYVNECCQNIKDIRIEQRKLTTSLAHLKIKMAANRAARTMEQARCQATCKRPETPGSSFVNKAFPLVFPPLVYRNRRFLSVS